PRPKPSRCARTMGADSKAATRTTHPPRTMGQRSVSVRGGQRRAAYFRHRLPSMITAPTRTLDQAVLDLVQRLHQDLEARRRELVARRDPEREALIGVTPTLRDDTKAIRDKEWQVAELPERLMERRVELLGGCSRPEIIDGMNSGAKSYIADLWDLNAGQSWWLARAHRYIERAAKRDLAYV